MKQISTMVMVFIAVTACALLGMLLGGAFGYAAGSLAPDLFSTLIPWKDTEPVGAATVCSAIIGVILGGGLGIFGVFIQLLTNWFKCRAAHTKTP